MRQGIVASVEDNSSAYFERMNLETHANMVVLRRNCYIANHSGNTVEAHPFSLEYESLKVPIVDDVT